MKTKVLAMVTLILLVGGVWFFYETAAVATRGGEGAPLYSSERHDPYGTAAIYDLLAERGARVDISKQAAPLMLTDQSTGNVMIRVLGTDTVSMTAPGASLPIPPVNRRLKEWLEAGNTVIEFSRSETPLMREYGMAVTAPEGLAAIEKAEMQGKRPDEIPSIAEPARWVASPGAQGQAVKSAPQAITMESPGKTTTIATPDGWQPLATGMAGNWVAAVRPAGKGRFIAVLSPTPILNRTLGDQENLEFVMALVGREMWTGAGGKRTVLFDEWSHGLGHGGTIIGFIRDVGLLPVVLQLMAVVMLYVWATSGYAAPMKGAVRRRRSSAEQIETLGHLYGQSLKPDLVFEKVYDEVRRRIAGVLRCAPSGIEAALNCAEPQVAIRVRSILGRFQEIGRGAGTTCPSCGFDLAHNQSGTCPECGAPITWQLKERIAKTNTLADIRERDSQSARRMNARLAATLADSYQFVQEHTRDRYRVQ